MHALAQHPLEHDLGRLALLRGEQRRTRSRRAQSDDGEARCREGGDGQDRESISIHRRVGPIPGDFLHSRGP